jgi:ParB family transcriptional regulator, chromosome partitioning protein
MKEKVTFVPIDRIRILNPRFRDRKKFEKVLQSIQNLGLKKPIKVSARIAKDGEEPGYDLVCGQGRIEAFQAMGESEIPAVVVEVSKEDRLLMSLVENMARRFPAPLDMIYEIERLATAGYSNAAIGKKLDVSDALVAGLISLKKSGEERLLNAALKSQIPLGVAIEIAKTTSVEAQRALLKAYENKQLTQASIRVVRRVIEQRRFLGKRMGNTRQIDKNPRATADGLVNTFRKETHRQKIMIKKAKICEANLMVVVTGFKRLIEDDNFVNLLRAESLASMPNCLLERLKPDTRRAA